MNETNLIPIESVAENTKAIKIGDNVFPLVVVQQGGGMDFYKCAAVYGPRDVGCFIVSGCPTAEANGTYLPTEYTTEHLYETCPVYSNGTYYYYYGNYAPASARMWGISTDYTGDLLYCSSGSSWIDNSFQTIEGMACVESTTTIDLDVPKTWDGYKAVLTDGVYSFEETLTTGLSYGTAFTPTVGGVYNSEVNIKIGSLFMPIPIPQSGLVFYAPLSADYVDMISGNSASVTAGSFTEINAKEGLRLTNEYIKWPEYSNLPVGENDISFGFLISPMEGSTRQTFMGVGNEDSCLPIQYENESILGFGGDLPSDGKLHTVLLTRAGSNSVKIYIDGILAGEARSDFYPESSCVCVGALMSYGYIQTSNAFFSEVFVYNRELTAAEVLEIHNTLMEGVTQ